tara:strand:- start:140 stop:706 length:567 start_codon:yes stop_codon:yes gene_type:complete
VAVNPHAETYQGKTQFSGPVKAGSRWDGPNADYEQTRVSTNPIAVNKLANAGYVVESQSCAVYEFVTSLDTNDIVLPAYSMVLSMQMIVTTAWDGATPDFGARLLKDNGALVAFSDTTDLSAVGVYNLIPNNSTVGRAIWKNIANQAGDDTTEIARNSVAVWFDSINTGNGRGIFTINYIPGLNLGSL